MWVDFRRYSSVYCDIVISQYCGIVALFVALLLSSHSGQILPPNTQIFTNFDWWRYLLLFLTLSPSNKSLWHGRHPADRCDNFLIFLHVGTGRGEPNVSLHHLFRRHFAGGGRRKKFPQKSFCAAKLQIPLRLSNMQQISSCAEICFNIS